MHFIKDPGESLDYGFNLVDWLSTGDSIASATWSITEVGTSTDQSFSFAPGDVTPGSNIITIASHTLVNNDRVSFTTTGTLPAGLALNTGYHIVGATATIIQLAATRGGSVITISDTGSGNHTVTKTAVNDGNLLTTSTTVVFVGGGTVAKTYKVSVHAITASTPPRTFDRSHTIEIREK